MSLLRLYVIGYERSLVQSWKGDQPYICLLPLVLYLAIRKTMTMMRNTCRGEQI